MTYVVGNGFNSLTSRTEALLWTRPVSALTCDSIDFNRNSVFPEDRDVIDFLNVLAGGSCSEFACNDIDFNNNAVAPEDADVIAFFNVLTGGECD
jgi:hypothetical protein